MKNVYIDNDLHERIKIIAAKDNSSIKNLIEEAINDFLEKKERGLTPNTLESIKNEILFLFKNKRNKKGIIWKKDLEKMVFNNLNFERSVVLDGINKLIESNIILKNYKDEISYNWELDDNNNLEV